VSSFQQKLHVHVHCGKDEQELIFEVE
jgi:hypothetical protein